MNRDQHFSDEFLNAFVDDQLAPEEKSHVYLRINQDEALNRRVCELRSLRDLVQLAYKNPPPAPSAGAAVKTGGRRFGFNVAAGLTLVLGVLLGWLLHSPIERQAATPTMASETVIAKVMPSDKPTAVSSKPDAPAPRRVVPRQLAAPVPAVETAPIQVAAVPLPDFTPTAPLPAGDQMKVLFHVGQGGKAYHKDALDEVEALLEYYRASGQRARVEVVINSDGLNLVRHDTTAHRERIDRMQKLYDNLTFAACQNTIDRLKREHGITAQLLPGVVVIDSGVAQIMRRQLQGWAYIEV
jgi:uncharacterized protein